MRPFFYVLLLFTLSCGGKPLDVLFGKTSKKELTEIKGEPLKVEDLKNSPDVILHYPEDEKYQITNDKVSAKFHTPSDQEKSLLYWKHKFKDCSTELKQASAIKDSHLKPEMELKCEEQGMSVVYTEGSPFISRIIEYAKE